MKLVAIDLDGTLLDERHEISRRNAAAVRKAQEQGIEVVISTGRMHFDVREICRRAGIVTPIISANGGAIHERDGRVLQQTALARDAARTVIEWLETNELYYEISTDRSIYVPKQSPLRLAAEQKRLGGCDGQAIERRLAEIEEQQGSQAGRKMADSYQQVLEQGEEPYKVYAITYDEELKMKAVRELNRVSGVAVYRGGPNSFEAVAAAASKGNALQQLAERRGLKLRAVAAIGDSQNDISMLEAAGYSVAMGNAAPEVKAVCRFVTRSNEEDGVAYALETILTELAG